MRGDEHRGGRTSTEGEGEQRRENEHRGGRASTEEGGLAQRREDDNLVGRMRTDAGE